MNGFAFTEDMRFALRDAREQANELHHEYIGTEHILLALVDRDCAATAALARLGLERDRVSQHVLAAVRPGRASRPSDSLPYTSRAKKVVELSMMEARALHHDYVDTDHLLLGIIAEEKGIAAATLADFGVTLRNARAAVLDVLSESSSSAAHTAPTTPTPPLGARPSSFSVVLTYGNGAHITRQFARAADAILFIDEHSAGTS